MDFYTQQAISDYFKNQRQQPLYNPADYGKTGIDIYQPKQLGKLSYEDDLTDRKRSEAYFAEQRKKFENDAKLKQDQSSKSAEDVSSYTNAASSVINIIATAALAAQQDKAERELYNERSELENKIFSGRLSTKEKQQELNDRVVANRSAFGASDLGIKTTSNQNSINSNMINNIVNALARAYLNKG